MLLLAATAGLPDKAQPEDSDRSEPRGAICGSAHSADSVADALYDLRNDELEHERTPLAGATVASCGLST